MAKSNLLQYLIFSFESTDYNACNYVFGVLDVKVGLVDLMFDHLT